MPRSLWADPDGVEWDLDEHDLHEIHHGGGPPPESEPDEWFGEEDDKEEEAQRQLKTTRELREEELAKGGE